MEPFLPVLLSSSFVSNDARTLVVAVALPHVYSPFANYLAQFPPPYSTLVSHNWYSWDFHCMLASLYYHSCKGKIGWYPPCHHYSFWRIYKYFSNLFFATITFISCINLTLWFLPMLSLHLKTLRMWKQHTTKLLTNLHVLVFLNKEEFYF